VLRAAIEKTRERYPFVIDAAVVLPDHIHAVWTLPPGMRIFHCVGGRSSHDSRKPCRRRNGSTMCAARVMSVVSGSGGSGSISFRDEADYARHVEHCYINPVKHELVSRVRDWPYSSFHRDVLRLSTLRFVPKQLQGS
jgi:putative transposase